MIRVTNTSRSPNALELTPRKCPAGIVLADKSHIQYDLMNARSRTSGGMQESEVNFVMRPYGQQATPLNHSGQQEQRIDG